MLMWNFLPSLRFTNFNVIKDQSRIRFRKVSILLGRVKNIKDKGKSSSRQVIQSTISNPSFCSISKHPPPFNGMLGWILWSVSLCVLLLCKTLSLTIPLSNYSTALVCFSWDASHFSQETLKYLVWNILLARSQRAYQKQFLYLQ